MTVEPNALIVVRCRFFFLIPDIKPVNSAYTGLSEGANRMSRVSFISSTVARLVSALNIKSFMWLPSSMSVSAPRPSVNRVAVVPDTSPRRATHFIRVEAIVLEVCSEEMPNPTRMMMRVGAMPWLGG